MAFEFIVKESLYWPPTSEEINALKEIEKLFKSSLFRMQVCLHINVLTAIKIQIYTTGWSEVQYCHCGVSCLGSLHNDAGEGLNLESNLNYKALHLTLSYNLQKE